MDSPNLINKKIEVGLFIIENCYNNFLLKTQIEGKNSSYKILPLDTSEPLDLVDEEPPMILDDEPLDLADPLPDDKPPKIARPSPARPSRNKSETFEIEIVPRTEFTSPPPPPPSDAKIIKTTKETPVEIAEKEKIEEILNEVVLIAEDEFILQFETVSEDIEVVKLAEERIKDYIDNGILWEGSTEFEIIEVDSDQYLLTSDLLNTDKTFHWCGAFIAFCYKDFIKKEIRKTYMPSTYRFAVFAQDTERHLGVQSLIEETSEIFRREVFKISNNKKLSQEQKTEKINAGIKVVKENLNRVFLKGYVVAMLPTKREWYGSHFGIILHGEVYAEIIDPETGEISQTGNGDLYFFLDIIEGNVGAEENTNSKSVRKVARNVEDIFAVYRFLPEDYIFNFKKEKEKVFDNAEITIEEIN